MSAAALIEQANDIRKELETFALQMVSLSSLMLGLDSSEGRKAERTAERILITRAVNAVAALSGNGAVGLHELYTAPIKDEG